MSFLCELLFIEVAVEYLIDRNKRAEERQNRFNGKKTDK